MKNRIAGISGRLVLIDGSGGVVWRSRGRLGRAASDRACDQILADGCSNPEATICPPRRARRVRRTWKPQVARAPEASCVHSRWNHRKEALCPSGTQLL